MNTGHSLEIWCTPCPPPAGPSLAQPLLTGAPRASHRGLHKSTIYHARATPIFFEEQPQLRRCLHAPVVYTPHTAEIAFEIAYEIAQEIAHEITLDLT